MKNKVILVLLMLCNIFAVSCEDDVVDDPIENQISNKKVDNIINFDSYGKKSSFFKNSKSSKVNSLSGDNSIEFESTESVVLPHLQRYIFPGSLLKGNSIQDLDFKPITAELNPVRVSLSIPATNYEAGFTMEQPSLSSLRTLVNEYLKTANFSQNGQLSYSIEEFTSYDELKVAFGSNLDTRKLFNKQSTTENQTGHMIAKRTGYYVKFYQTSFTLDMDIPNGGNLVKNRNFDDGGFDPVYVSSISYGRMGILTIETNEVSEEASRIINTSFSKIFKSGNTTLTEEEKKFLNAADFKILLLGGNANTAVQTFNGYEAFVQHITQGVFTKENPGVPIFCSYSYLSDNSPVKTKFRFYPIYVELVKENVNAFPKAGEPGSRGGTTEIYADFVIKYYSSRTKMPVIASPYIDIYLSKYFYLPGRRGGAETVLSSETVIKHNTLYQTSTVVEKQVQIYEKGDPISGVKMFNLNYKLLPDEKFNYEVMN